MLCYSMLSARFLSSLQAFAPQSRRLRHVDAAGWTKFSACRTALFSTLSGNQIDELNAKIKIKGEEIRGLKAAGVGKPELAPHIDELMALKAQLPALDEAPKKAAKKEKVVEKKPSPVKKMVEELSENELRLNRLAKVESMREAGVEPFEYSFETTHSAIQLSQLYDGKLEPGEEDEETNVSVAGRVMTRRVFGKLAFFTMQDETGIIQLQFDKGRLGDSFQVRGPRFIAGTGMFTSLNLIFQQITGCSSGCSSSKIGQMGATFWASAAHCVVLTKAN